MSSNSANKPRQKRTAPPRAAPPVPSSSSSAVTNVIPTSSSTASTLRNRSTLLSFTRHRNATNLSTSGSASTDPSTVRLPPSVSAPVANEKAAAIATRISAQVESSTLARDVAPNPTTTPTPSNIPSSLRYTLPRLAPSAGLERILMPDLGMDFDISGYPVRSFRRITLPDYPGQPMIAWSPNSGQTPHFAGRLRAVLPVQSPAGEQRRLDGSHGALDANIFPQLLRARPHLGFITRASQVDPANPWYAAYVFPSRYWRDSPNGTDSITGRLVGQMDPTWLEEMHRLGQRLASEYTDWMQQLWPVEQDRLEEWRVFGISRPPADGLFWLRMRQLGGCLEWDEALDYAVEAQYYLRHRRAWMDWARVYMIDQRNVDTLRNEQIRSMRWADDECVGLWVNGASEEQVLRLIAHAIPVFIMARAPTGSPHNDPVSTAFFEGSSTQRDYYDNHPSLSIPAVSVLSDAPVPTGFEAPIPYPERSLLNATPQSLPVPVTAAPIPADRFQRYMDGEDEEEVMPSESGDLGIAYSAPRPLADVLQNRRWTFWAKIDDPDIYEEECMKQHASRKGVEQNGDGSWYYDRELMRQIYTEVAIPRDAYRPDLFGFAFNETTPFYAYHGNSWVVQRPTTWVYPTERVPAESRNLIGRVVDLPSQASVPVPVNAVAGPSAISRIDTTLPSPANAEAGPSIINPVIATPRIPTLEVYMEDDEDRISLGSVDDPAEVLRIAADEIPFQGRSAEECAQMVFDTMDLATSVEALRAVPLQAAIGQGYLWFVFTSTEQACEAKEWLERKVTGQIFHFRTVDEFRDMAQYSNDVWEAPAGMSYHGPLWNAPMELDEPAPPPQIESMAPRSRPLIVSFEEALLLTEPLVISLKKALLYTEPLPTRPQRRFELSTKAMKSQKRQDQSDASSANGSLAHGHDVQSATSTTTSRTSETEKVAVAVPPVNAEPATLSGSYGRLDTTAAAHGNYTPSTGTTHWDYPSLIGTTYWEHSYSTGAASAYASTTAGSNHATSQRCAIGAGDRGPDGIRGSEG
ncbi:hypothetical protein C8F01DRAFT_1224556 [Mycena amicta]|nr:hypothetical protein C8F01DRAFT_1224556 [Mycena amicta]